MILDGKGSIEILYDQPIVYNFDGEISGFSYCQSSYDECDRVKEGKEWNSLDIDDIKVINKSKLRIKHLDFQDFEVRFSLNSMLNDIFLQHLTISYIWKETPVTRQLGLPIYADDNQTKLPSPPWKKQIF